MLRPSMRGGVPVLSRPTRRSSARRLRGQRVRRRIAGATAAVVVEADVDPAGQEGADRQHHAARREMQAR
jgi:hypothetical protein